MYSRQSGGAFFLLILLDYGKEVATLFAVVSDKDAKQGCRHHGHLDNYIVVVVIACNYNNNTFSLYFLDPSVVITVAVVVFIVKQSYVSFSITQINFQQQ